MIDTVKKLRELARNYADGVAGMTPQDHFAWEAADEIERLRRRLEVMEGRVENSITVWPNKTDIERRLSDRHIELDSCRTEHEEDIFSEAAAEIARLRAIEATLRAQIHQERNEQVAEIERLQGALEVALHHDALVIKSMRAENERLRRDLEIWRRNGGDILREAEIERLREEIKDLKLTLEAIHYEEMERD